MLEEGEYLEPSEPKIAYVAKPHKKVQSRNLADQILHGSVSKSALSETEKKMQQNTQRILGKLKVNFSEKSAVVQEAVRSKNEGVRGRFDELKQRRQAAVSRVASMDAADLAAEATSIIELSKSE